MARLSKKIENTRRNTKGNYCKLYFMSIAQSPGVHPEWLLQTCLDESENDNISYQKVASKDTQLARI